MDHKSHSEDCQSSLWESLYSGGAEDYKEPDVDIIEAVANLELGRLLMLVAEPEDCALNLAGVDGR